MGPVGSVKRASDRRGEDRMRRVPRRRSWAHLGLRAGTLACALLTAACTGAGRPDATATGTSSSPPPLTTPLVDASTRRPLGSPPDDELDRLAAGASAGTLLARSTNDEVCIFANGRNGWNRAAC